MDNFYRTFIPTVFWLGAVAFALALFMIVFNLPFIYRLTPAGVLHGAEALLLMTVASYCVHRTFVLPPLFGAKPSSK